MKLVVILFLFFSYNNFAQEVDAEAMRYDRCYMRLISEVPQDSDPYLRRIKQKTLNGADACVELLENANFIDGKSLEKISSTAAMDQKAFQGSLHTYLREISCKNCHTANHARPHSAESVTTALNSAKSLVNFSDAKNSKLVQKVLSGHQCGNNCQEIASRIETEILNWSEDLKFYQEYQYQSKYGYYNNLGIQILRGMTNFHRKWFNVDNPYNIHGVPQATIHIQDMNENAYYFLRAMFSDIPYSSVLTTHHSLEAMRYRSTERTMLEPGKFKRNGQPWLDAPIAPRGRLYGVDKKEDYIKTDAQVHVSSSFRYIKPGLEFNYTGNLGGGILGSQAYVLYNMIPDKVERGTSDGALHLYRRWAEAVFPNVLCRSLPVVREVDAVKYVNPQSPLPFRNGAACMQCHSSMDPVAYTIRNLTPTKAKTEVIVAHQYMADLPPNPMETGQTNGIANWVDEADPDFWKREPNGEFYFRDYKGVLHSDRISGGTAGLGEYIAKTDDFYVCAAKRYVNFFTGVDIPIFDPDFTNPATPNLTAKEQEYYNFIQKLALELKQHQDVRKTFERIFRSQAFVLPGKGVE